MARAYFCCYYSYLDSLEALTEEEVGRLFLAALRYAANGELPELTGNERYVFPAIRGQIDRDYKKYEERCEKNRENALQRYEQSDAIAANENEKENKNETDMDTERDTVTKKETPSPRRTSAENPVDETWEDVEKRWKAVENTDEDSSMWDRPVEELLEQRRRERIRASYNPYSDSYTLRD